MILKLLIRLAPRIDVVAGARESPLGLHLARSAPALPPVGARAAALRAARHAAVVAAMEQRVPGWQQRLRQAER
jgi:hypothetical protein